MYADRPSPALPALLRAKFCFFPRATLFMFHVFMFQPPPCCLQPSAHSTHDGLRNKRSGPRGGLSGVFRGTNGGRIPCDFLLFTTYKLIKYNHLKIPLPSQNHFLAPPKRAK